MVTTSGSPASGREPQQLLVEPPLVGHPVVLELQVEAVLAEDVAVLPGEPAGELPVLDLERLRDLAGQARRQPDQAFAVAGQMLAIDARLVVVAVDVGVGDEPAQVPVAGEVLGEEDQVEGLGIGLALLVGHRPAGDVRLDADDRLDALVPGRLVEGDRAVEGAVVGDRHRVHAQLGRRVDQLGDPAEAVEKAELRVDVEVREVVRARGSSRDVHGSPGQTRDCVRGSLPSSDGYDLRESYWGWFDDDMAMIKPWGFDWPRPLPVHIWQGRHDRMVPYGHGEWLAAHVASRDPAPLRRPGPPSITVALFGEVLDELLATRAV